MEISGGQLIYGMRPVIEALEAGLELDKLFVLKGSRSPQLHQLLALARQHAIPVQYVPEEKLNRLTRQNHQGVVAFTASVSYQRIASLLPMIFEAGIDPFVIMLDHITDVRNLGAIARTAEAAGAHAIIIPTKGGALVNADAVKTSAGALTRMNVCREDSLMNTADYLRESGIRLVAVTEKTDDLLWHADLKGPIALILGAEDTGISKQLIERCDVRVKIPMSGTIASLNVSVAAGMACYELLRQRGL
ncbi:MAG TPA: 23S rRNA (guanosine(2251)-2'-O)-methyltransferase RlmB [Bacteroidales bacterium]|nr:23S rRNA (guanosine(2251)-2'-O)-methyltransferase RlmB [Bacteroidales bacterium]